MSFLSTLSNESTIKTYGLLVKEKKGRFVDDVYNASSSIALLKAGKISVYSKSGKLLTILNPGDIYGISNLYSEEPLATALRCEKESVLVLYPKEKVRLLLEREPELMRDYCALLNEKIAFLHSRITIISASSNREKLARYLLSPEREQIDSREELALYLGMGRSALFRELKFFEENDCILVKGNALEVLDAEKIRSFI